MAYVTSSEFVYIPATSDGCTVTGYTMPCITCEKPVTHPLTGCAWCDDDFDADKCPEYSQCESCIIEERIEHKNAELVAYYGPSGALDAKEIAQMRRPEYWQSIPTAAELDDLPF